MLCACARTIIELGDLLKMSYQLAFCPSCGTRRVAYGYRCSVCDGLVRRIPVSAHSSEANPQVIVQWRAAERPAPAAAEKQPVAA
jgi:hypothetical protein